MHTKNTFAIIIIVIGLLLLLGELGYTIHIGSTWPILLLIPGVLFWIGYLVNRDRRDNYGLLIPGTILLIYSVYFFVNEATAYRYSDELSFLFILGVGLAFFAAHYLSKSHPRGLLIPAWILTVIAAITLVSTISTYNWWPVVLIVIGLLLLVTNRRPRTEKKKGETKSDTDSAEPPISEASNSNHV